VQTGNYSGNFFLNMTNTLAPMCAGMMGAGMAKENGEMSILGRLNPGETLDRLVECGGGLKPLPLRLLHGARYATTMLLAHRRLPTMRRRIEACSRALAFRDADDEAGAGDAPTAARLWERVDSLMDHYDDQWTDGIVTSSTSAAFMLFCMKLLVPRGENAWGQRTVAEIAALLGEADESKGTAESAGAVEALDRLRDAMLERGAPERLAAFAKAPPADALAALLRAPDADAAFPGARDAFERILAEHGHRCVKEAEMREKDWFEDPTPLVKMLQSAVGQTLARRAGAGAGASAGAPKRATTPAAAPSALDSRAIISSKPHLNPATRWLLRRLVSTTRDKVHLRELGKSLQVKLNAVFKHAYRRLSAALLDEGRLPDPDLAYFLTHEELGVVACAPSSHRAVHLLKTKALQRRRLLPAQKVLRFSELSRGAPSPIDTAAMAASAAGTGAKAFTGTPVSAGVARGPARVARTVEEAEGLVEGEILITPQTDVGWTPFFALASALVTEIGGMLSHGAVVAREYAIPCVVSVTGVCDAIRTGTLVEVDGNRGVVRVVG